MAYGFNNDRSKVDVYPKNQVYSKDEIGPGFSRDNTVNDKINELGGSLDEAIENIKDVLPLSSFDESNTVNGAIVNIQNQIDSISNSMFSKHGINPVGLDFDSPSIANGSYFVNSSSSGTFPTGKTWGILFAFSAGFGIAAQLMFCDDSLAYRIYLNDAWQAWTFC